MAPRRLDGLRPREQAQPDREPRQVSPSTRTTAAARSSDEARAPLPAPPARRPRLPPAPARDLRLQRAGDPSTPSASGFVREGVKRKGLLAPRRVGRRSVHLRARPRRPGGIKPARRPTAWGRSRNVWVRPRRARRRQQRRGCRCTSRPSRGSRPFVRWISSPSGSRPRCARRRTPQPRGSWRSRGEHLVRLVVRLVGDLEHLSRWTARTRPVARPSRRLRSDRARRRSASSRARARSMPERKPSATRISPSLRRPWLSCCRARAWCSCSLVEEPFLDEELPERAPHREAGAPGRFWLRLRR